MAYRDSVKTKLSKGILDMKFMKRSKDKAVRQQESEEGQAAFSHLMTEGMKSQMGNIIVEPSYFRCAGLIEGRLSFKGMNPEIERLMALEEKGAKQIEETPHNETDVTDLEMAKYHSSLVKTMASKFAPKRQKKIQNESSNKTEHSDKTESVKPPKKKPKFLKPQD